MKIAGILGANNIDKQQVITKMANAQKKGQLNKHEILHLDSTNKIASITTQQTNIAVKLKRKSATNNLLIISGLPITTTENLDQKLEQIVNSNYQNAAKNLTQLDGAFAALYWDNSAHKLVVVTDILGMQPLYISRSSGLLLLASEIQSIAASGLISLDINPAAWGAFATFGHSLANHTFLKNVQRVPPGSILIYDPIQDKLETKTYWQWPQPQPEIRLEDVDTTHLLELLEQNIKAYLVYHQPGTILLSGGFDSRLLLALLNKIGIKPEAVILAHEDEFFGADGIYATKIAKKLGISFQQIKSDSSFFSSTKYLDYLMMNEMTTKSLFLFISQVMQHLKPEMKIVWEGCYPGAILVPVGKQPSGGFREYLATLPMSTTSPLWRGIKSIFAPALAQQMYDGFLEILEAEKSQYTNDGFGVSQFIVRNRTRNRIATNPLQVYANIVPTFTPGLTKDFWSIAASLPFEVKTNFRLYRQIFQQHFPEMLTVPFVSGGKLIPSQYFSLTHELLTKADNIQSVLSQLKAGRGLLKILGISRNYQFFQPCKFLGSVIAKVNPEHPELNSEQVSQIKALNETNPTRYSPERELLFYWQVWRWIIDGEDQDLFNLAKAC